MNTRVTGVLLAALICITMVAPAMALEPSTPFVITGHVSDSDGSPCNGAWVQITNTNTSVSWDAENDSESNYYKLVLDSDNVSAGNVLRFEASGCAETKTVEHTVTQSELEDGGMIGFDIAIDVGSMPDLTVIAIGTPVRLRKDVINPISATVENIGSDNATSFVVTLEAGGSIVDTDTVTSLNAGENTTVEFLWTPSSTGDYTLNVTADANGEVIESDETNNSRLATKTVLDTLTAAVNVRIEGKDDTVWCGDVTFSSSVLVATDGSIHYLNEPTALGALDCANESGGFGYVLECHPVYGLYVSEINSEPPIGWDGWMYRVDYVSPWVGAGEYTLYGGEDVLWYFGAWTAPPLKIELDKTTVMVDEVFVATVTAYNDSTAAFDTVEAAEVYVDGALYGLTGTDGTLTMSLAVGDYQIHADKGTWAEYTRSEKVDLTVTPPFTATYDFTTDAGLDRWAYRYQTDAKPPVANDVPGIEFMSNTNPKKDQYVKISTDDRKMQSDSTDAVDNYSTHRFVFDITQSVGDIVKIEVLWNGKGAHTDRKKSGATLYIWNCTSGAYEELANTTSNKEVYLTGEMTAEIGSYIDATGNLTILAEQNSAHALKGKRSLMSKIGTDYVKVDITHT